MFSSLFNSTTIPVLEQSVQFAQNRHEILAGNIANLDTPGYRTRDLNTDLFQSRLKRAIAARDSAGQQLVSAASKGPAADPFDHVRDSLNNIVYHDQSNVGLEQQAAELAKNQIQHNLSMTILTSQFSLLGAAISERA
jgi:flagellar basal-body rod protein FlgB